MKTCKQCGVELTGQKRMYCSARCGHEFYNRVMRERAQFREANAIPLPAPARTVEEIYADWEKDAKAADRRLNLAAIPSVVPCRGLNVDPREGRFVGY